MINLTEVLTIRQETEKHFKVDFNGKEIWVQLYYLHGVQGYEMDIEIFKGKELLTEEEQEELIEFIENEDNR